MRLEWKVPAGQVRPMTSAVQAVMLATRGEAGCLGCSLSTRLSGYVAFRYEEEWDTEESLQRQVASERFTRLVALVEAATEPPTIEFTMLGQTRGLEYAAEVRGALPPTGPAARAGTPTRNESKRGSRNGDRRDQPSKEQT
jgi:quinol monooxygenase YgiN